MRWLKLLIAFLLLATTLIFGASVFYESQVENIFIKHVKNYFSTELRINGDISFSLIKNFPSASLTLRNIELRESLPHSKRNVLEAEEMSLLFNITNLFSHLYTVDKVLIRNGKLNLRTLLEGKVNYDVVAGSKSQASSSDITFRLKQAITENITVNYSNEIYDQEANFTINSGTFSGDFGSKRYQLHAQTDMLCQQFYLYGTNYLPKKKANLDMKLNIDFDKSKYEFAKTTLYLENNAFELEGFAQYLGNDLQTDFRMKGIEIGVAEALQLLPPPYADQVKGMSGKGILNFESTAKGIYNTSSKPAVNVQFSLKDGRLDHPQLSQPLRHINLQGSFSNGSSHTFQTSILDIANLNFATGSTPAAIQLKVTNLDNPNIELFANGDIDLSTFNEYLQPYQISQLAGQLRLQNCRANGKLNFLTQPDQYTQVAIGGNIQLQNATFQYNNKSIDDINATAQLNGPHLAIEKFDLQLASTNFNIKGVISNIVPLCFQKMYTDTTFAVTPVGIDLNFYAPLIDVEELTDFISTKADTTQATTTPFEITADKQDYALGKINLKIDKLKNKKLTADNIQASFTIQNKNFNIQQATLQAFGGKIDLRGDFVLTDRRYLIVKTFVQGENLDMSRFLAEFDNFGQTYLTDKQIKGKLQTKTYLTAYFDNKLNFDYNRFKLIADMSLNNGELIHFEPARALATFVKVSDLEDIKFAQLNNQIEISNRNLRIPAMFINSNAFKLTFSGMHSFDNKLFYYIKLNLLDLLTNKFKKKNRDWEANSDKGLVNLYVQMSGNSDNPQMKYLRKKAVKRKFEQDAQRPKTDLDKILEEQFGTRRGDMGNFSLDSLQIDIVQWADSLAM